MSHFFVRSAVASVLAVASLPACRAGADGPWFVEFPEARAKAKQEGKGLLIDFGGSDWCGPCLWLKTRILSRAEFSEPAGKYYVLVDIDDLQRKPMPADRKQRYRQLQERYGIETFPSVILADSEGRPYARTTYVPSITRPEAYWDHVQSLRKRGTAVEKSLAKAAGLSGLARAEALVEGLAQVPAEFVPQFYANEVLALRRLDHRDRTGYLSFLDGRKSLASLQAQVEKRGLAGASVADVNLLIEKARLQGETLQEALILRALVQVGAKRPLDALDSFATLLDAQEKGTRFDHGDFVPLTADSIATLKKRIAQGMKDPKDSLAQYHALHRIFEFELPDPYEISCGHGFRPKFLARGVIGEVHGQLLIDTTANLAGEARAKALGQGLEGTMYYRQGSIAKIVETIMPDLVGKDAVAKYLPQWYQGWVSR
jgi:thiol-disulfide isomerase/thioredoxin